MQNKPKYIKGNEAFYDEDKELFYCHVGLNEEGMPLICSAWGATEQDAINQASEIIESLSEKIETGLL